MSWVTTGSKACCWSSQWANICTPTNDRRGVTGTSVPWDSDFFLSACAAGPPFPAIETPCLPQAIDLTEGDRNLPLRFCDRMEHHTAGTGGIVVQQLPKKGLVSFRHFSPSIKCWTRIVRRVLLDYMHASILLKGSRWHIAPSFA